MKFLTYFKVIKHLHKIFREENNEEFKYPDEGFPYAYELDPIRVAFGYKSLWDGHKPPMRWDGKKLVPLDMTKW